MLFYFVVLSPPKFLFCEGKTWIEVRVHFPFPAKNSLLQPEPTASQELHGGDLFPHYTDQVALRQSLTTVLTPAGVTEVEGILPFLPGGDRVCSQESTLALPRDPTWCQEAKVGQTHARQA